MTSSQGKDIVLRCSIRMSDGELEEINWLKDDEPLYEAETSEALIPLDGNEWQATCELSLPSVQLSDAGNYRCIFLISGMKLLSDEARLELEGLPHFSMEPEDMSVTPEINFNLSCLAEGPPEPVMVIWLQDGAPLNSLTDPIAKSPSLLAVYGLNKTSTFSCEAHNTKGVTTSRTAVVRVLPGSPRNIQLISRRNDSLEISWEAGPSGIYPTSVCTVQAALKDGELGPFSQHVIYNRTVTVPPYSHMIRGLTPFTAYSVCLTCRTSEGDSQWTNWISMETLEGVPDAASNNITASVNATVLTVWWSEAVGNINGILLGYKLAYERDGLSEEILDVGLHTEVLLEKNVSFHNITLRVAPYTSAGEGPWSEPLTVINTEVYDRRFTPEKSIGSELSWHWWYVIIAVSLALSLAILTAVFLARLRRKETRYGQAFMPDMEQGEPVVRYRVRKTYTRRTTEATLNNLGISDELKEKLRDVMIDRHKLALGKTLGEGEFGAVMEGQLNQDGCLLKVAVKTMKITICTRSEMEDFLREAVCMKEFDHPNVMRLIGVCLQNTENEGYPSPVVILPFMKHGDLHSYLLYSRLGDNPVYLPTQRLVKFMTDVASGMEYLSSKNFIHRDLAARNCMLDENMNVCVADFGLSKKIYNGDYYRQGRISKMPVKWIAIESLADRIYTSKSDVWSYGVTMWEIATRGQTPYPGVENSEIYDYLRQGNRLKQPPDCLDGLYQLMLSCWMLNPKDRPTFETLHSELKKILENLPPDQDPEDILYVNMEPDTEQELGAVGGFETGDSDLQILKGHVITADVHRPGTCSRYVLCPPHEGVHLLSLAQSSENLLQLTAIDEETLDDEPDHNDVTQ